MASRRCYQPVPSGWADKGPRVAPRRSRLSQADATFPYNRLQYLHRAIISPAGNWEKGDAPVGRVRDALNNYDVRSLRIHDKPPAGNLLGMFAIIGNAIDALLGNGGSCLVI